LQGAASVLSLPGAEALLLSAAHAGGEVRNQENHENRKQSSRSRCEAEYDGKKHSDEGCGCGDGPQAPGAQGKGHGEADGRKKLGDGR
jgi:hypothetical protein